MDQGTLDETPWGTKRCSEKRAWIRQSHFAEQIWWHLMGNFDGLEPEYEVKDWRGRSYFVDFMWLIDPMWAFRTQVAKRKSGDPQSNRNRRLMKKIGDSAAF